MSRTIIHLDLDAFFCAVEENKNPSLHGRAFAVGGRPEERGVVASCSYAARKFGIRSAMPMSRALRLCPSLLIIPGRHKDYSAISRQVMEVLRSVAGSPYPALVEQISIDEAFIDVTEFVESENSSPAALAQELQARINQQFGLPCSLGVATNKLVAKIATDVGKTEVQTGVPPNAIKIVSPGKEEEFLAPLPADALWGVGPKTAERLADLGIHTIGDIARWPEEDLITRFGKNGHDLASRARGIDGRPIVTSHEVKSVSQETTFAQDIRQEEVLLKTLSELSNRVSDHLRKKNLAGITVKLKLRWSDFTTLTRQETLDTGTNQESMIYTVAKRLFESVWRSGKPVRLLGVGVSGLRPPAIQLGFWDEVFERPDRPSEALSAERLDRESRLESALDALRERYGEEIIHWGEDFE